MQALIQYLSVENVIILFYKNYIRACLKKKQNKMCLTFK